MNTYIASVRHKDTRELKIITGEYKSMASMSKELRANGYSVRFIATEETFDDVCEKYNTELDIRKRVCKKMRNKEDK